MKCVLIEDGVVVNSALFEVCPSNWIESDAGIGFSCVDGVFSAPEKPGPCLETCRSKKLAAMRKECESHIVAGFIASVLFPDCNYRNDRDQQQTIREAAEGSGGGHIWMNEDFAVHTKTQAQAVFALSKSEKAGHQLRYSQKCEYLGKQARTIEEINAVTWDSND